MKSESESCSVVSNSLQPHGLSPWNSPGQNAGVGSFSLLQGIFPTQGSNPGLLHYRLILYHLSHKRSTIWEWVAYPLSSGSSQPRNPTRVSCIAGGFFTNLAMREAIFVQVVCKSQVALVVKNPSGNAGDIRDTGLIPVQGRFPGGGSSNPLQYSCLGNPMDRGAGRLQSIGSQRVGHD